MKVGAYGRIGVQHGWYVDPSRRELSVYELRNGEWGVVHMYGQGDVMRAPPFGGVELELGSIWADSGLP